ncbi:hypothetical protein [Streptomyces sp. NBC_01481]|uniref:hypothetical protein n=1 Tax=Streptomyces sp. NBC_01481 TaxID=2975869 RepID=UPI002253356C|nr:hypothetical protein [Streptomyces sp. NBC_01481]MCX4585965.1 hypothetical protein [Streptomyces sp. NBC_01481]
MKLDVFRIGASLATATLTVLASTACGTTKPAPAHVLPEAVHHSELVGRWDGGRECRSPLPVIRLRDDYTFSVKDFPVAWDGPGPDSQVTRRSTDGKWHAVNKDPGLTPYLVLKFENEKDNKLLPFYVENGELGMSGSVPVPGEPGQSYSCYYKRTSADPDFGR